MALLETFVLTLGPAIGNTLLKSWLGEGPVVILADNLVDLLTGLGADKARQRKIARQLATIGQQVADEMQPFFDSEARNLAQDERAAVVHELAETLRQARLSPSVLVECRLDPDRLMPHLRSLRSDATRDLSDDGKHIYERMLYEASRALGTLAPQLDGFMGSTFAETWQGMDRIADMLIELAQRPDRAAQDFERDYRHAVQLHLDRMDYFGIQRVDRLIPQQPLSAAYVTLQIERRMTGRDRGHANQSKLWRQPPLLQILEHDEEGQHSTQSGPVDLLLAQSRRLVIRGEAGGGKSTLLRWIAVGAARQKFDSHLVGWNDCVPFFIRLRERVGQDFPTPNELPVLVAQSLSGEMPQGWARQQLKTGRALVLVDGVDELPRQDRVKMLEQLDALVREYPLARYIISSRPSALKADEWPEWADWIVQADFVEASLQPLDTTQIEHLIDKWHDALARNLLDPMECAELAQLPTRLKRQLRQRPALRRLATNPLLCAMLCALHRERGAELPSQRIELYEECVKMLLEGRDIKRGVAHDPVYPRLSYDQKLALLKSLALWLMRNSTSDLECSEADEHFERELPSLGLAETGKRVRAFFVERGALLREPVEGRIDFAHRTFQEFLAAQAALEEKGVGELLSHALDDQWRETIILSAGKARPKECDKLLRDLIDRGNKRRQASHRQQMHVLAVACLETAVKVPHETRQYVLREAATLFPPQSVDEARLVAAAGDPAVPLLRPNSQHNEVEAAMCVHALALIGTDAALQAIVGYTRHAHWQIQQEIGRAWEAFDHTEYAHQVLTLSDVLWLPHLTSLDELIDLAHIRQLSIQDASQISDLASLAQLPALTELSLYNCPQLTDLAPLAQLPTLTELFLYNCPQLTDLTPLAQLPTLTELFLYNCPQLTDFTPLAQIPTLTRLSLSDCPQLTDLAPLAQLPALTKLSLSDCPQLTDLAPLAQLPALTRLSLSDCAQLTDLAPLAQLPTLSTLDLAMCPQLKDLAPLAQLHALITLYLSDCPQLRDFTPLAHLRILTKLYLYNCPQLPDLAPLAHLLALTTLTVFRCPQITNLASLAYLSALTSLHLSDCPQLTNLAPLAQIPTLTELSLSDCPQLSDLVPLAQLTALTTLYLFNCPLLTDLAPLAQLPTLSALSLSDCPQLTYLAPLAHLPALTMLYLYNCPQINDLSLMTDLTNLTKLYVSNCPQINDLRPLAQLSKLTRLDIRGTAVRDISPVREIPGLIIRR